MMAYWSWKVRNGFNRIRKRRQRNSRLVEFMSGTSIDVGQDVMDAI